jgi:uncharacterized membrane protein
MVRFLIIVLALGGLINSLYFTLAYYGRVKKSCWVPEILCAREGSTCVTVVQTPYARVFGLPNSLLGILYYLALLTWVARGDRIGSAVPAAVAPLRGLLIAASVLTVALGFYLIFALRRRLHVDCPLCYAAHAINAALLVLLLALAF